MSTENSKRIAKNTMLLYVRMLFTMAVSLYTSRVVLNTLGVEDFGIYNVVGGVVSMLAFLTGSMSAAAQRFISFELGREDYKQLKKVFCATVSIHFILAFVVFVLAETAGLWFLNTDLNISANRMVAANWVYQCSVLSFIITIISVPYNASIIAHEHMKAFAYVSILEVGLKLLIVFLLVWFNFDKLILYAILVLSVAIIVRIVYGIYCKRHFEECKFALCWDKELYNKMLGFAGWNLIGAGSAVARDQGVNIALNIFCGVTVNAARGIAMQVCSAINGFVTNFQMALNPQITKSYASGDHKYMMSLIQQGARFSFYLLFFLSLPVLIETETIVKIWLNIVPDYIIIFVRLVLIFAMIESLSGTLITAMLATGKIRNYQIIVGGLQIMNFPLSYYFLRLGYSPESTLIIAICLSLICLFARIWMLRGMIHLSAKYYVRHVVLNILIVSICSLFLPMILFYFQEEGWMRFISVILSCVISSGLVMYFIGLSSNEKIFVKEKAYLALLKIRK